LNKKLIGLDASDPPPPDIDLVAAFELTAADMESPGSPQNAVLAAHVDVDDIDDDL
jgi:hypothetical protein